VPSQEHLVLCKSIWCSAKAFFALQEQFGALQEEFFLPSAIHGCIAKAGDALKMPKLLVL
jgi:hypothetical protein